MTGFATLDDIRLANEAAGGDFFAWENTRHFRRNFDTGVIDGRYFIASELRRKAPDEPGNPTRRWTIYRALDDGIIEIVGEFQQHPALNTAKRYLKNELGVQLTNV